MSDALNDKGLIELVPINDVSTSDSPPRIPTWIERRRRKVPNRPGFRCPACDYDVRGLASLRCPECGCEFTVGEAHLAGLRHDPLAAEDWQAIRRSRLTVAICAIVFILSFCSLHLLSWTLPTSTGLFGEVIFACLFIGLGVYHYLARAQPAAESALIATLTYVMFMVIVNIYFW